VSVDYTLHRDFGAGRMLVLLVASRYSTETGAAPYTSVDGSLRQFTRVHTVGAGEQWAFVYFLDDANLPRTAGTYRLRVYESGYDLQVTLLELSNVNQSDPFAVRGGSAHGSCTMDDPSDALTVSAESWLLSVVAYSGIGSPLSGQTVTHNQRVGSLSSMAGYLANVPAGNSMMSWSADGCTSSAHALVALRPR
ncbi:MAG TPA: hypothetical protein VK509_12475, partial [Polyangiales bacterium]|nr:hypothetical protein [Polyangiales bacterium]